MELTLRSLSTSAILRSPSIEVQVRCQFSLVKYGTGLKYGTGIRYGQTVHPKMTIEVELYEGIAGIGGWMTGLGWFEAPWFEYPWFEE